MGRGRGIALPTGYVCRLDDAGLSRARAGGKGASLARLTAAAFPVPPGFVVTTTAYDTWAPAMPPELAAEILAHYERLGSPPVAVRSSATAEDLPGLSFAGQQDTELDVRGPDVLLDAVRRCWASLQTERAVAYRAHNQVDGAGLSMAVVVQTMVAADAAGVLFTADPVSGDRAVITINAGPGLGEGLVSGEVTPEAYGVERAGTEITRTVIDSGAERVLDDDHVRRLAQLGVAIADLHGQEMDVEWCRSGDDLSIVQARPITTTGPPPDPWNDSRSGDFLWTNTNVGEAIPDVMTPATWSMVQVFMSDAMATASVPPYIGYGRIGGRVYLNVSVMMTLSRAVGVSERRYRELTAEVFGRLPEDLVIPPVAASRLAIARGVGPMAVHVLSEARRDVLVLAGYLADHPRRCAEWHADIAAVGVPGELADLWTTTLDPELNWVSWMLSAATRSSGATFVATRQRLQRLVGDAGANALTAGLGSSAGPLASLGLLEGLDRLAEGQIDRDEFNRTYGHRGPHEFELSRPRPGEDPEWIDGQLAERAASRSDYRGLLARQEEGRRAAWAELEARHPWPARILRRQLRRWAKISRDREGARSEVIRYFWVLRAFALRAGELTGLGEDIFFLEAPEIVRVLRGETISQTTIAERRQAYAAYSALPPYPVLIRGTFDPYSWAADPDRRTDIFEPGSRSVASDQVRGFPGSAGVVVGRVRVLTDPADGAQLEAGEVLVTTVTNVGWTPLFPRVAAVVTDVGAPLSHAAIVAREIGIPAVVGCGNATMRLKTGDRVRVDGTAGTVELLA